jgi:hypothetical protein
MKTLCYTIIFSYVIFAAFASFAGEYPKTRDERRAEEMGSVLGGEGVVFRPTKIRNLSTKTDDSSINTYLWRATTDIVDDIAPIASSDGPNGLVVTEWYSNGQEPNRTYKLKVHVTGDVISPESIKVELKQRILQDGRWLEDKTPSRLGAEIEDKILRRARQLYLRKSGK